MRAQKKINNGGLLITSLNDTQYGNVHEPFSFFSTGIGSPGAGFQMFGPA
jgi:hypothetical protein